MLLDKFRDECGVFGIYGHFDAARLTYLGLYALQHRGQESCGIVTSDGLKLRQELAMGHVAEAFDQDRDSIACLEQARSATFAIPLRGRSQFVKRNPSLLPVSTVR